MAMPVILIFAFWLGLPVIAIWQILSAKRRFVDRTCPECDYDMTGTPVGGSCPECGIIPAISWSGRTNPDRVLCRNCGHDLEGLLWNADCPECGLHSAALPRFRPRESAFLFRAVLGSILLAIWIGLTIIIAVDWYDTYQNNRMRGAAIQNRKSLTEPRAAEQAVTTAPAEERD